MPALRKSQERPITAEDGFTMIEVLIAGVVLALGIVGMVYSFDSSRRLSLNAERHTSIAHRAQTEIERLQAVAYEELAMTTLPTHSSEKSNPDYYVEGTTYQWDPESSTKATIVNGGKECTGEETKNCGVVKATPSEWTEGSLSGKVYAFVTWATDSACAVKVGTVNICKEAEAYKRVTVVAMVDAPKGSQELSPIRISTIVADPNAAPANAVANAEPNPLESPQTKCGPSEESCTAGIEKGDPHSYYLHDSYASLGSPVAPTTNHTVHATVAATGICTSIVITGCAKPDLMDGTAPTATTLYDYSTDLDSNGTTAESSWGGRALKIDKACSETPSEDNTKGEMWVTAALSESTTLTGVGGLAIYSQALGQVSASVSLCVGVYDLSQKSFENIKEDKPTLLGTVQIYKPVTWPASLTQLSFTFTYSSSSVTIASGHRIGLRLWPSSASESGISLVYDTTAYPSVAQLNTQ